MRWKLERLVAFLVLLAASPGVAQQGVTFEQAIAAAQNGPRAAGLSEALSVRQSRDRSIRGLPSDPQLQLMPGARVAPDGDEGFEFQATLTQSFTLGALGTARRRAAEREREELEMAHRAEVLSARLDTARAWIDAQALTAEHASMEQERASAMEALERLDRAVAAGERTRREAISLQLYAEQLQLSAAELSARAGAANRRLAASMSLSPGVTVQTEGSLPAVELPAPASLARRFDEVGELPAVARLRIASLSASARAAESRAGSLSQIQLGVSLQADQPGGFVAFGVIGFQPRLAATDARETSVQLAEAARLEGEHAQALRDSRRFAADVLNELSQARAREERLRARVRPAAQLLVELEERAFAEREGNILAVLDARRRLLEAERMLVAGEAARVWSEVEAWLLLAAIQNGAGAQRAGTR